MNLILGGGITGLSLGWRFEEKKLPYLVVEKESAPGGLCRSVHLEVKGKGFFHFDLAGHVLHLRHEEIKKRLAPFIKTCLEHQRKAWIHMGDRLIPYPFQAHIAALPSAQAEECLVGFAKAWAQSKGRTEFPRTFAEWADESFGEGIVKYFMKPYNEKLWTVPLRQLNCDWMGRFVPQPSIEDLAKGFVTPETLVMGYNPTFVYPKEGGIEGLVKWLRGRLAPRHLRTGAEVVEIDLDKREVGFHGGERQAFAKLYSTLPLPDLVKRLTAVPADVRRAAERLRANCLAVLYLALDHPVPADRHWVYMPERRYSFYRVGFPSNLTPHNAPKGCGSLLVERALKPGEKFDAERWAREVIAQLTELGWISSAKSVLAHQVVRLPHAYVIYDHQRAQSLKTIQAYLASWGVTSLGRYGAWEYCSIEDNLLAGLRAASA